MLATHVSIIVYKKLPNQAGAERTELGMYVSYPICMGMLDTKLDRKTMRIDLPLGVDCPDCIRRMMNEGFC